MEEEKKRQGWGTKIDFFNHHYTFLLLYYLSRFYFDMKTLRKVLNTLNTTYPEDSEESYYETLQLEFTNYIKQCYENLGEEKHEYELDLSAPYRNSLKRVITKLYNLRHIGHFKSYYDEFYQQGLTKNFIDKSCKIYSPEYNLDIFGKEDCELKIPKDQNTAVTLYFLFVLSLNKWQKPQREIETVMNNNHNRSIGPLKKSNYIEDAKIFTEYIIKKIQIGEITSADYFSCRMTIKVREDEEDFDSPFVKITYRLPPSLLWYYRRWFENDPILDNLIQVRDFNTIPYCKWIDVFVNPKEQEIESSSTSVSSPSSLPFDIDLIKKRRTKTTDYSIPQDEDMEFMASIVTTLEPLRASLERNVISDEELSYIFLLAIDEIQEHLSTELSFQSSWTWLNVLPKSQWMILRGRPREQNAILADLAIISTLVYIYLSPETMIVILNRNNNFRHLYFSLHNLSSFVFDPMLFTRTFVVWLYLFFVRFNLLLPYKSVLHDELERMCSKSPVRYLKWDKFFMFNDFILKEEDLEIKIFPVIVLKSEFLEILETQRKKYKPNFGHWNTPLVLKWGLNKTQPIDDLQETIIAFMKMFKSDSGKLLFNDLSGQINVHTKERVKELLFETSDTEWHMGRETLLI